MFENYIDSILASKVLKVHSETVKRLIRGKVPYDKVRRQVDNRVRSYRHICWKLQRSLKVSIQASVIGRPIDLGRGVNILYDNSGLNSLVGANT